VHIGRHVVRSCHCCAAVCVGCSRRNQALLLAPLCVPPFSCTFVAFVGCRELAPWFPWFSLVPRHGARATTVSVSITVSVSAGTSASASAIARVGVRVNVPGRVLRSPC